MLAVLAIPEVMGHTKTPSTAAILAAGLVGKDAF
jgi:hypothetical protein